MYLLLFAYIILCASLPRPIAAAIRVPHVNMTSGVKLSAWHFPQDEMIVWIFYLNHVKICIFEFFFSSLASFSAHLVSLVASCAIGTLVPQSSCLIPRRDRFPFYLWAQGDRATTNCAAGASSEYDGVYARRQAGRQAYMASRQPLERLSYL